MNLLRLHSLLATLTCALTFACASSVQEMGHAPEGTSVQIERIAVAPFYYKLDYPQEAVLETPEQSGITPEVPSEKGRLLAQDLYEQMVPGIKTVNTVYFETSAEEFGKVVNKNPQITYRDAALRTGRNLGVDAVLIGNLFEYEERRGGELGVSSPASVAFDVQLLDTRGGTIIWEAYYAETQKPLLRNIFELDKFIKRGGKWVTAGRLAEEGVVEIVKRLNRFLEQSLQK